MKTRIMVEVRNRKEAKAMARALALPEVKAFVLTVGVLEELPSHRARRRVLGFVEDSLAEARIAKALRAAPPTGERQP